MPFKPSYKGHTVRDAIYDYMCWSELQAEGRGEQGRVWTIEHLRARVGCSTSAAHRAVRALSASVDISDHWFRTEGGLVKELYISLK